MWHGTSGKKEIEGFSKKKDNTAEKNFAADQGRLGPESLCLCRYAGPPSELMLLAFMSSEFIPLFCNHNKLFSSLLYGIAELILYFF
jgi:hypothetical protein